MESKTFTIWGAPSNRGRRRCTTPGLTFTNYDRLYMNCPCAELLKLKDGERVQIIQGNENKQELYICKTSDLNGIVMHKRSRPEGTFTGAAMELSAAIHEMMGTTKSIGATVNNVATVFPKYDGLPVAGYRIYLNRNK